MYIYIYAYIYIYMYVYIYTYIHIYTYISLAKTFLAKTLDLSCLDTSLA